MKKLSKDEQIELVLRRADKMIDAESARLSHDIDSLNAVYVLLV